MTTAFTRIARRFIVPATGARSDRLRLVFDIEANGLLGAATTVWCIVIIDLDSGQIYEYGPGQISAALAHLARADVLIGHNIIGYDLPALEQLHDWRPKAGCAIVDTLVAGRLILPHIADLDDQAAAMGDPKLGKLRGSYKLEAWGVQLDIPKVGVDIEDWSQWTPAMQARCVGDTRLAKTLYHFLQVDGYSEKALALEHRTTAICDRIKIDGVPFAADAAERLHQQWTEQRAELEAPLQQQFPSVRNFNSRPQLGRLLESLGWTPEKRTPTGLPSISDEVLEAISTPYPELAGIAEYMILGRRLSQLANGGQAWLKNIGADGRIHGSLIHIGTPHSRAKHLQPNMAQVPSTKKGKPFAAECRALFRAPNDWVFVACDQANLQDRGLAHFLTAYDDGRYAQAFIDKADTHWQTAIALGLVAEGVERNKQDQAHTTIREGAKTFRYAFLFGCGAGRTEQIVTDTARAVQQIDPAYRPRSTDGRQILNKFIAATPGLQQLRADLELQVRRHGWLLGLDRRRVPARALKDALNYLVVCSEAVLCKYWLINVYDELCARFRYGWDGDVVIVLWVHDELVACCRPEIAEQVGEIMVQYAKEAGEHYGFKVPLDAEYKIGRSWAGEPVSADPAITSDEGLQVVSVGAEPAVPELVPELAPVMPEKISTAPEMISAVTNLAPVGSTSEMTSTDAESMTPEPARILDDDGDRLGAGSSVAAGLESAGVVGGAPLKSVPQPLTIAPAAAPGAAEAQPSKLNGGIIAPVSSAVSAAGNGRNQDAAGNYGDRSSEQHAGKPYGVTRTMLMACGYRVTQTFPFQVPGEVEPRFFEDRRELKPGITASTERPRKTCRYWHRANGQELNDTGPRRIIYNWPAIMGAGPGANVFITEGANKCKPLNENGLLTTATPYHQWGPECVAALAGYHLFYLADHCNPLLGWSAHDNDPAARYAEDARKKLAPRAASFRIVPAAQLWKYLPSGARNIELGDDIVDWLELGGNPAKLLEICCEVPAQDNSARLQSVRASTVTQRAIAWLWADQFALGKLGILAGLPDEGKSLILNNIAACITHGRQWPNGEGRAPQGSVILLTAEDDPEDTVVPRLVAAGADLDRIELVQMVRERNEKDGQEQERMFNLARDLPLLQQKIDELGNVNAILIDPVTAYMGTSKTVDTFRDSDVRAVLTPFVYLARERRIAIIVVMHFNKKVDITNALLRISNSLAFGGVARHVFSVTDDAENARKLMARAKNNLAARNDNKTLAFHFDTTETGADPDTGEVIRAPFIVWEPGYVDVTATEALSATAENKSPGQKDKAKEFLRTILASGPMPAKEAEEAAAAHLITKRTLERAKDDLDIITRQTRKDEIPTLGKCWVWQLPE